MALRFSPVRSFPPVLSALGSCPSETSLRSRRDQAALASGGDRGGGGGAGSRGVCQLPQGRGHLLPPPPLAPASRSPPPPHPPAALGNFDSLSPLPTCCELRLSPRRLAVTHTGARELRAQKQSRMPPPPPRFAWKLLPAAPPFPRSSRPLGA